jgi:O-acetyl-ADP-ribose deacetylase (regulator of RNase III)
MDASVRVVRVVSGSLLDVRAGVICHQANCTSRRAAGLARAIFDAYPAASRAYSVHVRTPGTIDVTPVAPALAVAHLFAQIRPGRCSGDDGEDSASARERWFSDALAALWCWVEREHPAVVAFPWGIGCGLAGGDWRAYHRMIDAFAARIGEKPCEVALFCLPQ